ncbi:D-allose-binding periplasmic protein precursor [Caulifigura coniformis]|uniref:D-allose-binding periplasmic protein n=1 Tax=Caulifigura coniformis TaxID=2527983 RepID=A0A517SBT0_9PLAN|nr:substrate-binding domain-containing protein [Caulifigura coniformis]QDT53546.1 D-allose-binding periplasmic protein precursor [Caulifigura coniformis]
MRSRRFVLSLFGALCAAVLTGCPKESTAPGGSGSSGGSSASGGSKRIVILTNGDDPFWDACESGAKQAEKDLGLEGKGFTVAFERADFTDQGQIDKLKQYNLQSDIAAVGISVFNPESRAIAEELRQLQQKGVKVITIDGDMNREKFRDARYAYLGTDNLVAGKELGRAAKAIAGGTPLNHVFFVGSTTAANAVARMDGFNAGVEAASKELERLEDGGDRPKARSNVESALDRHKDISALVGIWAYNTPQISRVVADRKIRDKTKVFCFDAAEESIRGMQDGNVDVMLVQNPFQMGADGVKLMLALIENNDATIKEMYPTYAQTDENDMFKTELRIVVPDNQSTVTSEILEKSTRLMKLSEFKKWLEERKLVSS